MVIKLKQNNIPYKPRLPNEFCQKSYPHENFGNFWNISRPNLKTALVTFFKFQSFSIVAILSCRCMRNNLIQFTAKVLMKENFAFTSINFLACLNRFGQAFRKAAVEPSKGRPVLRNGRFSTACFGRPFTNFCA